MTPGRIERNPGSIENALRLGNHYSPWERERAVPRSVAYCDREWLREAIGNITPDDPHHGRPSAILSGRAKVERLTSERRKKENLRNAA